MTRKRAKKSTQPNETSLRELFKSDMTERVASMRADLDAIERADHSPEHLDALIKVVQTIKGSACLSGLVMAEKVADATARFLNRASAAAWNLDSSHVGIVHEAVDCLIAIADAGANDTEPDKALKQQTKAVVADLRIGTATETDVGSQTSSVSESRGEGTEAIPPIRLLFLGEVREKAEELTQDLLALEQGQATQARLEAMMRIAHTIKGGARISGLLRITEIAHVMEDIFTAIQTGRLKLESPQVDILLQAVDTLLALAEAGTEHAEPDADDDARADHLIELLRRVLGGKPLANAATVNSEYSQPSDTEGIDVASSDRFVRVSADSMDRIIGLAGEMSIEAKQLKNVRGNETWIRRRVRNVANTCSKFSVLLEQAGFDEELMADFRQLIHETYDIENAIGENSETLQNHDTHSERLARRMFHEALSHRMRPFGEGVSGLARLVRDLSKTLGRDSGLEIVGADTRVDRDILEALSSPLTHLVQNAVDHGIEAAAERRAAGKPERGTIRLEARHKGGRLSVTVEDDGRGVDVERLREEIADRQLATAEMAAEMSESELFDFLLLPGFTLRKDVSEVSGRGVGLDIVREMVKQVRGSVHVTSRPGHGTRFELTLPTTLSVLRCVVFEAAGEIYALPVARVGNALTIPYSDVFSLENRQYFRTKDGNNIGLVDARQVLELPGVRPAADVVMALVIGDSQYRAALAVDRILYETDLVERPLDARLGKVRDVSSAAFLDDRTPVLILDADDVLRSIERVVSGEKVHKVTRESEADESAPGCKRILVVDDSITVREMERNLLASKGYEVDVAVDGADGWNAMRLGEYHLVVTDVDMPRMDGIELIGLIRKEARFREIPVVVVSYKDRKHDRDRGLEAGADYYLTKGSFEDDGFVDAVVDLIGEPSL